MKRFLSSLFFTDNGYLTASREEYKKYLEASSLQEQQQSFPEEPLLTKEEALEILQKIQLWNKFSESLSSDEIADFPPSHRIIEAILLVGYDTEVPNINPQFSLRNSRKAGAIVNIANLTYLDQAYDRQSLSDYRDHENNTILHKVVAYGDSALPLTKDILKNEIIDCNIRNQHGQTPLHLAITHYAVETIKELFKHTTDIEIWREFLKEPFKSSIDTAKDAKEFVLSAQSLDMFEIQYVGLFGINSYIGKFQSIYKTLKVNTGFTEELLAVVSIESLFSIVEAWSGYSEHRGLSQPLSPTNRQLENDAILKITLFFLQNKPFLDKIQHHHREKCNFIEHIAQRHINRDVYNDLKSQKDSNNLNQYFSVMRQTIIDTIKPNLQFDRDTAHPAIKKSLPNKQQNKKHSDFLQGSSQLTRRLPKKNQKTAQQIPHETPLTNEKALEILQKAQQPLYKLSHEKITAFPASHLIIKAALLVGYHTKVENVNFQPNNITHNRWAHHSQEFIEAGLIADIMTLNTIDDRYHRPSLLDYRDHEGNTILHQVVAQGDPAVPLIRDILSNDINIHCNTRNQHGQAPLHVAITKYARNTIQELFQHTTDIEIWRDCLKEPFKSSIDSAEKAIKIVRSAQTTLETFEIQYVGLFNIHLTANKFTHIYETLNTNKKFVEALFTLPVESLFPIVETWGGYHEPGSLSRDMDHLFAAITINSELEKNPIPEIILFFLENKRFLDKIQNHPWRVNFIERIAQSRIDPNVYKGLEVQKNLQLQSIRTPRENKEILDQYFSVMRQTIIDTIKPNLESDRNMPHQTLKRLSR